MTKLNRELRDSTSADIRAEDGDAVTVSGYAAVFDQRTSIGGWYDEIIAKGAFAEAIGRDDVVFLINHEGLPLARTRSGTLILREDDHGLHMESTLDETDPDVLAIVPKMKRGDLDKMSFAFLPTVQEWDDSGDIPVRTIKEAQLFDVSIVTSPAYDGTDIGLRSFEAREMPTFNHTRRLLGMKTRLIGV
ncbi:MAG: HK97 family phage prohead protease [Rhodobacteraceae bacterium]|nr:HK97 family phage prohead protease [Paracoccaceae bacterium]